MIPELHTNWTRRGKKRKKVMKGRKEEGFGFLLAGIHS